MTAIAGQTTQGTRETLERVHRRIDSYRSEMLECLGDIIRAAAVGPKNGGPGEWEKVRRLEERVKSWGFDEVTHFDCPDPEVKEGTRPNVVLRIKGRTPQNLWIITHLDVVPIGDRGHWNTEPFEPVEKDGKIFGRGSEDNGQGMTSSLYAAKALLTEGIRPDTGLVIMLSADEETGSEKGVKWLLREHGKELFHEGDLILVPDGGNEDGTLLEVTEKTILWLKVVATGKQCHGSTPAAGINAGRALARFITLADERLHRRFTARDTLFDPPYSTFEPTKHEANVPNINTVPGEEIVYFDNRILPSIPPEQVMGVFEKAAKEVQRATGARFRFEHVMLDRAAPPTSPDSEVARRLDACVRLVYRRNPFPGGIGGGTYAAMFRRAGFPAVVWCTCDMKAHGYDEYAKIDNLVGDAKVFAAMAMLPTPPLAAADRKVGKGAPRRAGAGRRAAIRRPARPVRGARTAGKRRRTR